MKLRVAMLALGASLIAASPAAGDQYTVTGSGDNVTPAGCDPAGPGAWTCTQLRGAVRAANLTTGEPDTILITSPTVNLPAGQLDLTDDMTISGVGARQTTVDATGAGAPAFRITGGAIVTLGNMTVRRGTTANVDVIDGSLGLAFVRLTDATSGVGLLNEGEATVTYSLIDGNPGGGIRNVGGSTAAILTIGDSTIAGNTGAGINSIGSAQNEVDLFHATIARNTGAGLSFDGPQLANANASIFANNSVNCTGGSAVDGTFNVESTTSCAFDAGTNRVVSDPLLAAGLSNQGGPTDVLTIPANSSAADYVTPCFLLIDQRAFTRPANQPCDAGAYDRDAVGEDQQPEPEPTPEPPLPPLPPPPAPPAQPTPTPEPTPVVNRTVVADEVRGTVKVQLPGTKTFVDLDATRGVPVGSTIDTRNGAVELTSVPKAGAPPEKATFYDGLFKVTQSNGVTILALTEELDCPKGKRASLLQKKPKKRKLWGDGKGAFRTQGKYSAATVRGTKWLTEDTCTTTTVRVTQGSVTVQDLVKKKRVVVRAGKRYVARAKT